MTPADSAPRHLDWRTALVIGLAALVWFLPGTTWGLPAVTPTMLATRWGVDELGPNGALIVLRALLGADVVPSPQYPLGHYLVQALFVWPYHVAVLAADNLGFPPQTESVTTLVFLHRLPSVLMAAGTVVLAAAFVRRLTGHAGAAWFAAAAVVGIAPLAYYGRTSNVDAGALFWVMLGLLLALDIVRTGFTPRRAALIGLCAAIGIATKDQQYAVFLGIAAVLLYAHFRPRAGIANAGGGWRGPLTGLAVAIGSYLVVSGAVLLPRWFLGHVEFIRHGSASELPQEILGLVNTYYSNPATVAGYASLAGDVGAQLGAAVGIPLLLLAVLGAFLLARREPRATALLAVPSLMLVAGVILPVRFVLPRFLLPIDLVACLLAGVAVAEGLRSTRWRRGTQLAVVATLGWGIVRGADLTWQMTRDSRYETARWLEANLQPGDTLAYFGARFKLPRLHRELVVVPAPHQYLPEEVYGPEGPVTETPPFIIVVPQLVSEAAHEWNLPDSLFAALVDGSLGYDQVLAIQTRALFPRPLLVAPAVNPAVRVFARRDRVAGLPGPRRLDLPPPPTGRVQP